ncbi:STAS domain-containing protein [Streptomyces sp. NPDC020742]|uniref:STAS domain-containing protein n=1 Tax=unclassified Streptomyces TaxID=2593676 RepID=UPI0033E2FAE6
MISDSSDLVCHLRPVPDPGTAHLHVVGDLDYDTADDLLDLAVRQLSVQPALRDLHLDCARLTVCDSSGLSALLAIRRRTGAAGIRLHLDHRPRILERLLTVTGTLAHLTAPPAEGDEVTTG